MTAHDCPDAHECDIPGCIEGEMHHPIEIVYAPVCQICRQPVEWDDGGAHWVH